MNHAYGILLCIFVISGCGLSKKKAIMSRSNPISHDLWGSILQDHVKPNGWLDYQSIIEDRADFDKYITLLAAHHPNPETWSREERMAYWINAYNAYTVQLILDNYPVKTIKEIKKGIPFVNGVWDIKFINIEGQEYSLNNIEHGILRPKFSDPRIHMVVNCASYSCPPLLTEAFEAKNLDLLMDKATRQFLKDKLRNNIGPEDAQLSSVFKWYKGDFTKGQTLKQFLNNYLDSPIKESTDIEFLEYNWTLNDAAQQQLD